MSLVVFGESSDGLPLSRGNYELPLSYKYVLCGMNKFMTSVIQR